MITVPELQATSALLDTDLVVITHANGQSEKMTGATLKSVISEDFQPKELETPLTIAGNEKTTVEDALDAIDKAASNLPTDPVLHYSFDELPDYPEGTAIYKKINDFTDTTGWGGNATASVDNGKLTLAGASGQYKYYTLNLSANNIIFIKGVGNVNGNVALSVKHPSAQLDTQLITKAIKKGEPFEIAAVVDENSTNFSFYSTGAWGITISAIYIGDVSYVTPIIDNANGQNNATNNGGIAVRGVSGKGILLLEGKSVRNSNFNLTPNFTISAWFKPNNITINLNGILLFKQNQIILRNGGSGNNNLLLTLYDQNNNAIINQESVNSLLPANAWTHIVIARENTTCKVYLNGKVIYTKSLQNNTISNNTNDFVLGGNTLERITCVDDLQIFDRALSESEVMALYQNKANTPKHYTLADYQLKQKLPAVPSTDGTYSLKCTVASGTPTYSWVAES